MRRAPIILLLATAVAAGPAPAQAPAACNTNPCSIVLTANATVNTAASLAISAGATTLTPPAAADFGTAAGVNSAGPTLTVRTNAGFALTASAATSSWTRGLVASTKPAADLRMTTNGGGTYTALGAVGASSGATAGTSYVIGYKTLYGWTTDVPGSYSLVVDYTLTAP